MNTDHFFSFLVVDAHNHTITVEGKGIEFAFACPISSVGGPRPQEKRGAASELLDRG
jgi:hypothetical protein